MSGVIEAVDWNESDEELYARHSAERDVRGEAESCLQEIRAAPERVKNLCGWRWLREALESLPKHAESP